MDTSLIVGITSSIVAFISAIFSVRATKSASNATIAHDTRKEEDRKRHEIARFNEPLSVAVYELQSRIYNIICQRFIAIFYTNGSEREKRYVVENTVFVISQYFCWTELVRREVQGSGYGKSLVNSEAIKQQDIINSVFGSDNEGRCLMIFAGEQRHLGEALIRSGPRGPECMGYREFMIERPLGVDYMLDQIRSDIRDLEARLADAIPRLLALHKALINYLDAIDPNYERFLQDRRQHISAEVVQTLSEQRSMTLRL